MTSISCPPALHTVLGEILSLHAPQSVLLANLGDETWMLRAGEAPARWPEFSPPAAWLERGELAWLSQEGALLGLLWNEAGQELAADAAQTPAQHSVQGPALAQEMLTLLLGSVRRAGAEELEVLVTQLPAPTAWLSGTLHIRKVSRSFLEMFGLKDADVEGQPFEAVFSTRPAWWAGVQGAAAGRTQTLPDEPVQRAGVGNLTQWVRAEARPYFGAGAAGVLVSWQDVTEEHRRGTQLAALLDTPAPAALLTPDGLVTHASRGLLELTSGAATPATLLGTALWSWPCFAPAGADLLRDLLRRAARGEAASGSVEVAGGPALSLGLRKLPGSDALVLQGQGPLDLHAGMGVLGQVLSLAEDATILLDAGGRVQLVSDRAATLLGLEAGQLSGLSLLRVLGELGVRMFTPQGEPLTLPEWREMELPWRRELLLALPDGTVRQVEMRADPVGNGTPDAASGAGRTALLTLRDLTSLRRTQAKLRHDARHDSLTGLLNRLGLREALGRSELGQPGGVVLCAAVRDFEALQAALGRTVCDRLLLQLAVRLNELAQAGGGQSARLADDLFALVMPPQAPNAVVRAVQARLREPLRAGQREVPLSLTLGLALIDTPRSDAALADAEVAVQHARRQPQAQVGVYTPGMRAQVASAFELEDALRGAVVGEQFTLLYQPALHLPSGRVRGAEALLRWQHPTLGLLTPGQFLPLAARSDLITHVSEWVVQSALRGRFAVRSALAARSAWQVSVNLGLDELRRSAGLKRLLPALTAEGAPDIEVAAHSLLDHSQEALAVLEPLRALGARLSVDDFGEGASSLTALTRFPLGAVKLHPTLISRLPDDPRSVTLVEGTVSLAHRLGLEVVAVGVETAGQLELLRDLGCDAAQGYAIAPPLELPALLDWLRERPEP